MADVFLSYSRQDKALAARFVELLEGVGWDVFWDQETRAGTLWPKVLEDELGKARCLLVLWTSNSVASRWVRIEAYEALQNDKLLPILLERVKPPLEFRQTQIFDLIGWTGETSDPRLPRLFDDLAAIAGCAPPRPRRIGTTAGHTTAPAPRPAEAATPAPAEAAPQPLESMAPTTVTDPQRAADGIATAIEAAPEPPVAPPVAPRTAQRDAPAPEAAAATAQPVAIAVARAPLGGTERPVPTLLRSRRAWLGAIVAAVIPAVWLLRAAMAPEPSPPVAAPTPEAIVPAPSPAPTASTPAQERSGEALIEVKPTRPEAMSPPTAATAERKVTTPTAPRAATATARADQARCIAIAEKFQTTGQLTDEERRFLGSKECAQ
jgi:hypothetical protein